MAIKQPEQSSQTTEQLIAGALQNLEHYFTEATPLNVTKLHSGGEIIHVAFPESDAYAGILRIANTRNTHILYHAELRNAADPTRAIIWESTSPTNMLATYEVVNNKTPGVPRINDPADFIAFTDALAFTVNDEDASRRRFHVDNLQLTHVPSLQEGEDDLYF